MAKQPGLHRHVCRRFFVKVAPAIPELVYCDRIDFKRWQFSGKALSLHVPTEDVGMALYAKYEVMQSAARELGIPVILIFKNGRHFSAPIDCRIEEAT